jgi:hypothetical protein
MKHLKNVVLAATALAALFSAGSASATTLEIGGVTQSKAVSITVTLQSSTSTILRDTFGISLKTCTGMELNATTASPFTGTTVTAPINNWAFTCDRTFHVHKAGTLHIAHIKNTTNGTLTVSGSEFTTDSPFGTLSCRAGVGTHIGTLTGAASPLAHATIDLNAVTDCSGVSTRWTGTFIVTSPTGLGTAF